MFLQLAIVITFALAHQAEPATFSAPSDFGLRLEFGFCTTDIIDTFKREYLRDLGTGARKKRARIAVSGSQLAELSRLIMQARFFEYPSVYRPDISVGTDLFPSYRLTIS